MYTWTKVATFKDDKGERGHRIFRCEATGGFVIADNSGELPEQTDYGVVWMDPRVTVSKNSVTFNLLDGYHTGDPTNEHNLRTLAELAARWPDSFRVKAAASDAFFGEMLMERFEKLVAEEKARLPKTAKVQASTVREGDSILTSNGMRVVLHVATRFGVTVIAVDDACSHRGWSVLIFDRADSVQCERGGDK